MPRAMQHFNGGLLCVVDVETTGLDPMTDEITQLAILPLNSDLDPLKEFSPVDVYMRPRHPYEYYKKDPDLGSGIKAIEIACQHGRDSYEVANLLIDVWFAKLQAAGVKFILPLAHNWIFDSAFLRQWLGKENFNHMFHHRYRDTLALGSFMNDLAAMSRHEYPFPKLDLNYMISCLKLERTVSHDALEDCRYTALVYKAMVKTYFDFWTGPVKSLLLPELETLPENWNGTLVRTKKSAEQVVGMGGNLDLQDTTVQAGTEVRLDAPADSASTNRPEPECPTPDVRPA